MRKNLSFVVTWLFIVLTFSLTACGGGGNDSGGVTPVAAVATEVWVGTNGQGNTSTTLTKTANGTITITGQWTYNYQGTTVTCSILAGSATITGADVTISGTGTATNPAAPAGYQTSPFTLSQTGSMSGGQGSGTFTITFQTSGWPAPISGNWTAQKQSGSGVTNTAPAANTTPVAGDWTATTDFGKLVFTVDNTGTKITKMNYQFSNWKCGNVTQSGGTTASSNWLITNGVFLITNSFDQAGNIIMDFGGTYNSASNKFSGTWNEVSYGTNCFGAWEASAPK